MSRKPSFCIQSSHPFVDTQPQQEEEELDSKESYFTSSATTTPATNRPKPKGGSASGLVISQVPLAMGDFR